MKERVLNYLKGFFRAFEWINHRSHEYYRWYSYEIDLYPPFLDLQDAIDHLVDLHFYWGGEGGISLIKEEDEWKAVLARCLIRWLFEFQSYFDIQMDELISKKHNKENKLSLSKDFEKEILTEELLEEFDKLGDFETCYTIHFYDARPFGDIVSDDLLFLAQDCSVFVHFGVSD